MHSLSRILAGFTLALALAACAAETTTDTVPTVPTLSEAVAAEPALSSFAQLSEALGLDLDEPWMVAEFTTYTLTAPSNDLLDQYASAFLGDDNDAADLIALAEGLAAGDEERTLLRLFIVAHFVPGTHLTERILGLADGVSDFVYWVHETGDGASLFAEIYSVDRGGERVVGISPEAETATLGKLRINPDDVSLGSFDVAFDRGILHVIADAADLCCSDSPF